MKKKYSKSPCIPIDEIVSNLFFESKIPIFLIAQQDLSEKLFLPGF